MSYAPPEKRPAKSGPRSIEGSLETSNGPTEGYSCTLYKDYLVLYGGKCGGNISQYAFVYNLKEKKFETNRMVSETRAFRRYSHSACFYEASSTIIFYGGKTDEFGPYAWGMTSNVESPNPALRIQQENGGVSWALDYGLPGLDMPSPISNVYDNTLYLYQHDESNSNFGTLRSYRIDRGDWQDFSRTNGKMRLSSPSDCAIFCDNSLYLFAENEDHTSHKRAEGDQIFEDIYVLDIIENERKPRWRRISPGGQVPGLLTNASMAAADGIIYVFGTSSQELSGESRSVLWTYDTRREAWSQVKEIGTMTARPHQRAVVYKEQLLVVNWNHQAQSIDIQYQNLNNLIFTVASSTNKQVCRDQADSFIQHSKNLYNGRLFADITFEVEGEEIPAHKAILAYRSEYFMRMFTSGMSESHSTRISISNMKSHIFKAILQYIYCNELELDEQLALDLIPVVDEYLMKGLKGLCEKYLCKQLRKDNAVDMLIVADRHEIEELKKACFRFILKNLGNIDENEELMKLSKSLFIELLKFNTTGSQSKPQRKDQEEEKSDSFDKYGSCAKPSTSMNFNPNKGFVSTAAPNFGLSKNIMKNTPAKREVSSSSSSSEESS